MKCITSILGTVNCWWSQFQELSLDLLGIPSPTPWKINSWNLKITGLKRKIIWTQPSWLWAQNDNFQGCTSCHFFSFKQTCLVFLFQISLLELGQNSNWHSVFFWGETRVLLFCYLFASGPCRPKIISSPFPPQQKTGSFATKISDFPGGNGYPQVHQLGQNIPSMSPTNWKHDSRGMAGTKNIHVSTGSSACDLNFFVLYWWPNLRGWSCWPSIIWVINMSLIGRSWHGEFMQWVML